MKTTPSEPPTANNSVFVNTPARCTGSTVIISSGVPTAYLRAMITRAAAAAREEPSVLA